MVVFSSAYIGKIELDVL